MQQETIVVTERMMGVVALASLTAGIVAGIGARIIMRIVALTANMPTDFSIAGTLNILVNGIVIGFIVGFIITMLTTVLSASPKAGKYVPGPAWRGLIFGLLLLLVGFPILVSVDADDFALGIPLLNKIMFGILFVIYGLTLGVAEKAFDHYLPRKPTSATTDIPAPNLNEE
ncbi:MAG: hypothetical protein NVS4B12_15820 [Ktedonobacteraceae bacterium]